MLGLRLARVMSTDPDAESAAAVAAWKAHEAFDASRGVPLDNWVTICVRRAVWASQKPGRHDATTKPPAWWLAAPDLDADDGGEWSPEWSLLVRHFVDKTPRIKLAEAMGTTVYDIDKRIAAAVSRLQKP